MQNLKSLVTNAIMDDLTREIMRLDSLYIISSCNFVFSVISTGNAVHADGLRKKQKIRPV